MQKDSGPTERILILENDEGIAWLMSTKLTELGYEVDVVDDEELLRSDDLKKFDLLIFDYKLGRVKSGLDCYRELQQAGVKCPMILVTGFGDEAVLVEALRLGVRDFVPKTGRYLEMLSLSVQRIIEQVRSDRSMREQLIAESSRAAVERAVAERHRMSSMEAHHRVKNSFQIVTSLLSLQLRRKGSLGKNEVEVITAQVRGLSLIHDILTNLMKSGTADSHIALKELIQKLTATLPHTPSENPINVALRSDGAVSPRVASSVAVVLTELLLNALKHGSGDIVVSCEDREGSQVLLTVENEGVLTVNPAISEASTGLSLVKFLVSTDLRSTFTQEQKESWVVSSCLVPIVATVRDDEQLSLGEFLEDIKP